MQTYTIVEMIKEYSAGILIVIYVLALIEVLIKEHIKNIKHEYYEKH